MDGCLIVERQEDNKQIIVIVMNKQKNVYMMDK